MQYSKEHRQEGHDRPFKTHELGFLPLWPDVGRDICGLSRNSAYAAARRGEIPTTRFGKTLRVPMAWVRQARGS
jgi:hypothetical protein